MDSRIIEIEKACAQVCEESINMYVPWYLMAAYAYYEEDDPILSDRTFDLIAKKILEHWDEIEHRHKNVLTKDMLTAGTFIGEYPSMIKGATESVRKDLGK